MRNSGSDSGPGIVDVEREGVGAVGQGVDGFHEVDPIAIGGRWEEAIVVGVDVGGVHDVVIVLVVDDVDGGVDVGGHDVGAVVRGFVRVVDGAAGGHEGVACCQGIIAKRLNQLSK